MKTHTGTGSLRHRNEVPRPSLPDAPGRWYFRGMSPFIFWGITKESQCPKDQPVVPGALVLSVHQDTILFTPAGMAWRCQTQGHGQEALCGGAGGRDRTKQRISTCGYRCGMCSQLCEQAPGEWVVEGSQTEGRRARVAFSTTAHPWLCPVWEQCPEVIEGLTQVTCLSTADCAGVLSANILMTIRV